MKPADLARCGGCGAAILWCVMDATGAHAPLDALPTLPAIGVVAYNPATGKARVLSTENIGQADSWRAAGASFHVSHFSTCSAAATFRRRQPANVGDDQLGGTT